jgi:hypothetical protein
MKSEAILDARSNRIRAAYGPAIAFKDTVQSPVLWLICSGGRINTRAGIIRATVRENDRIAFLVFRKSSPSIFYLLSFPTLESGKHTSFGDRVRKEEIDLDQFLGIPV